MDIYANINKGVYSSDNGDLEKLAVHVICACEARWRIGSNKNPPFCPNCGRPLKEKLEEASIQNKEIRSAYNKLSGERKEQFKKDLFEYYGVPIGNHQYERAFSYAQEHGPNHTEIVDIMGDLINIIKD